MTMIASIYKTNEKEKIMAGSQGYKKINFTSNVTHFEQQANKISESFQKIKENPLNLNVTMAHIGILSLVLDDLLRNYAKMLTHIQELHEREYQE